MNDLAGLLVRLAGLMGLVGVMGLVGGTGDGGDGGDVVYGFESCPEDYDDDDYPICPPGQCPSLCRYGGDCGACNEF